MYQEQLSYIDQPYTQTHRKGALPLPLPPFDMDDNEFEQVTRFRYHLKNDRKKDENAYRFNPAYRT